MKRLKYLIIVLVFSVFMLASCAGNKRDTPRTIELTVESSVVPEFSANYGEGSYDASTKVYTHKVDFVKDLYIYLSKAEYKTEKIEIKASEMTDEVIKKTVKFGNRIPCSVEITFGEVEDLNDLEYDKSVVNNATVSGNILKFDYNDKNLPKDIVFKKPGYNDITVSLTKENMISGKYEAQYPFLKNDEVAVTFVGGMQYRSYRYIVGNMDTNAVVAQGLYTTNSKNYVVLPNNNKYFIVIAENYIFVSEKGKDLTIDLSGYEQGYKNDSYSLSVETGSVLLVDKRTNEVYKDSQNYFYGLDSLDNYYFVTFDQENNKVKYLYDIESVVTSNNGNKSENSRDFRYDYRKSDFTDIDFEITVKNKITKEIVTDYYVYEVVYDTVKLENNKLIITGNYLKNGNCYVNLLDSNNNIIATINDISISSNMNDWYASGTTIVDGKPVAYAFPLFIKNLVYDSVNNKYTYPDQKVDTSKQYITLYDKQLYKVAYDIYDEKGRIVNKTNDGYFEVKVGSKYFYNDYSKSYGEKSEFTVTLDDVTKGFKIIEEGSYKTKTIIVPKEISIRNSNSSSYVLYKDNSNYKLLISSNASISSIYVDVIGEHFTASYYSIDISDSDTINLGTLWVKHNDSYSYDNATGYVGDNGYSYCLLDDDPKVYVGYNQFDAKGIYDEELGAYICDPALSSGYKIIYSSYYYVDGCIFNQSGYYFINSSTEFVTINGTQYNLSDSVNYYVYSNDELRQSDLYFS